MVKIDVPSLTDDELTQLRVAVQCETNIRAERRRAEQHRVFADSLIQVDPFGSKYRWHLSRAYITPTHIKKFRGGFFVRPKNTHGTMYAKTKTGVLYEFRESYRKWEKVV